MKTENRNLIVNKTFAFALLIIEYTSELEAARQYVIARQLLKSGTSIGANVREAQNAESLNDFIHKMKIAAKEADETQYWLELIDASKKFPDVSEVLAGINEILAILNKIIASSKQKVHSKITNPIG